MQVSRQDREDCGKEEVTGPTIDTVYSESRDHRARDAKVLFEKGKERERERERDRKKKTEAAVYSCIRTLATLHSNTK